MAFFRLAYDLIWSLNKVGMLRHLKINTGSLDPLCPQSRPRHALRGGPLLILATLPNQGSINISRIGCEKGQRSKVGIPYPIGKHDGSIVTIDQEVYPTPPKITGWLRSLQTEEGQGLSVLFTAGHVCFAFGFTPASLLRVIAELIFPSRPPLVQRGEAMQQLCKL